MKSKNACGSLERRNLGKIGERKGLYSKDRPLFICTTKLTQGRSVNSFSGITLIALVVTIVVLLILASVSITVVFGDNGLIEMAKEAANKTNKSIEDEQQDLQNIFDQANEYLNGGKEVDLKPEPTLQVELKLDETSISGNKIKVLVDRITSSEADSETIEEELTYNWYKDKLDEVEIEGGESYTFEDLDEEKEYTLKCKVINKNGEWGIGEVSVISFKVENMLYRAKKGSKWSELANYLKRITPFNFRASS